MGEVAISESIVREPEGVARVALSIHGVVQGVGMRPFVHALARRWELGGFVRNETGRVVVEVEGAAAAVEAFVDALRAAPPPLARLDEVVVAARVPTGERAFHIESSGPAEAEAAVPVVAADTATCSACLAEVLDPADRRHRHPFANCTDCGPRLTIVVGSPYDRARTTMAPFQMCPACRREYDDPGDRRFHAQPIACPDCGPRLQIAARGGDGARQDLGAADPLADAADRLVRGAIGAIKGLGGYHLACDATNPAAVGALRQRKRRDAKPFAILVADVAAAEALCFVDECERALLTSREAPIVLLTRRQSAAVADAVAPGLEALGVMLPPTPLHHLLARAVARPLVLTSGNVSDEPMAFEDEEAWARLGPIADFFLAHDRPVRLRCDDSVARAVAGAPLLLRRSRGFAPLPLRLPRPLAVPTLAVGGHLKNVFALGVGDRAYLGPHIGDLDEQSAAAAMRSTIEHYERLFRISPQRIVHDRHPDYATSRYAVARAAALGIERVAVQHHHAHVAACMIEHELDGPAIGVAFDGMGYGDDGALWGGEFLIGTPARVTRAGHLEPVELPGGDRAAREPWRMAIAYALRAGVDPRQLLLARSVPEHFVALVTTMIRARSHAPLSTSIGRLFDAAAALAGVALESRYEGEAAMMLEALARRGMRDAGEGYAFDLRHEGPHVVIDGRRMIRALVADAAGGAPVESIAARFHVTVAHMIRDVCVELRRRTAVDDVLLSGGVFCNAVLVRSTRDLLAAAGFRVFGHRLVPPNDAGLAFGQLAAVAALDAEAR